MLQQPPARRQVAVAHVEMSNDAVSMDVNFWKLEERHSREKKTLTVLNIVDAPSDISHAVKTFARGWLRWARNVSEWILIVHRSARNSLIKRKDVESLWTLFPLNHWHMGQVENHARYLRKMGNRTVEDLDIHEEDFQPVAG